MPFAAGLRESLDLRRSQACAEFINGDGLERVLTRHLVTVEVLAEGHLITSILQLTADGKRLSHCAARGLPQSYCEMIDGSEIGPFAGSCGTAAYFGRPVYVADIATDPLWADYRHLALPHGLASCWSTPIRGPDGAVIGTFAVYRRTVGNPTNDEIEAIDMIAEHVAHAMTLARNAQVGPRSVPGRPHLRLVGDQEFRSEPAADKHAHLMALAANLESKAAEFDRLALNLELREVAQRLERTAEAIRKLVAVLRRRSEDSF